MRGFSVITGLSGNTVVRGPMVLPCPGSVGQQPAALMDAFSKLEEWTARN